MTMTAKAMVSTSKQPRVSFANAGGRVAHGHHGNREYNALWKTEGKEVQDVSLQLIQGKLPEDLQGNFYVNGPDGHGFIRKFHIKNSKATLTSRFVQTKDYIKEKAAGKILGRGTGTVPIDPEEGIVPKLEDAMESFLCNPANTTL